MMLRTFSKLSSGCPVEDGLQGDRTGSLEDLGWWEAIQSVSHATHDVGMDTGDRDAEK